MAQTYDHNFGSIGTHELNQRVNVGASLAKQRTELGTVDHAMSEAQGLCKHIEDLASRICGVGGGSEGEAISDVSVGGVAPEMADRANSLLRRVREAHAAIARIEAVLP